MDQPAVIDQAILFYSLIVSIETITFTPLDISSSPTDSGQIVPQIQDRSSHRFRTECSTNSGQIIQDRSSHRFRRECPTDSGQIIQDRSSHRFRRECPTDTGQIIQDRSSHRFRRECPTVIFIDAMYGLHFCGLQ